MLNTIEGVSVIKLITHADKRGFFREILRETDDFFSVGFGHTMNLRVITLTMRHYSPGTMQKKLWRKSKANGS